VTLVAAPAVASADGWAEHDGHDAWSQWGGWSPWGPRYGTEPDVSLVHGVPGLSVDIYVYKNLYSVKKLSNVQFATAADLDTAFPGWVTPGYYVVPAASYDVTVTAPNTPATAYKDLGSVALAADTNTLAFAIGTFPSTFEVVTPVVPIH